MPQVTVILSEASIASLIDCLQRGKIAKVVGGDADNKAIWLEVVPQKGAMYSGVQYG